ncbi:hypothetical protein RJ640_030274 [Escallonia rubra]|uniref:RRM domain-containing protein n=1 Tax=Escallonia rubra TaxID=112253 RepID=A0AA88R8Z9_9ASTE|nr:hypothetical protein RJ640_030274 [Escallonia rubra]
MSCLTKPVIKPVSMANGCLISVPAIFTAKPSSFQHLTIPSRPIKFHLSCSSLRSSSSLFLKKKKTHFPSLVTFVAEDNTVVLEEEEEAKGFTSWEGEGEGEGDGEGEGEGESEVVEAVGDAGESGAEEGFLEEEYTEPSEDAKVFVGNLPFDVDSETLAGLFGEAGIVEMAEVIYNRETDQSRGFGFVTMSTVEEAEKSVEMFHRYDLNGRFLTVNKAAPRGTRPERPPRSFEPAYRIYVGNLPWDVDDARLEQVFSEHGKVENARVVYDRESGRSRGFGFVTMSAESEVNDAIANLDGQSLGGRAIRVNIAEERPRRF